MANNDMNTVAETLKTLDRDRYYATLILAEPHRSAVQGLYAALSEIATVGERVRDPMPGEIRLQWWSDLLSGEARGEARQNPLAAALMTVIARYGLPAAPLQNLIAARRFDLYADPMPDVAGFETYAGETVSVPLHLAASILNDGAPPENGDAAGHLGVALACFGHIRAFGFNAARNRLFLPLDLFQAEGVSETEIFARRDTPSIRAALERCRMLGTEHLDKARLALKAMPRTLRPAFAPIALLDTRANGRADPFLPPVPRADWLSLLRLMWFGITLA